jgi:Concanavalin A-like lectin/glucanases superfamily
MASTRTDRSRLDLRRLLLNRQHPLNQGRVAWWKVLPSRYGGQYWWDLVGDQLGSFVLLSGAGYGFTAKAPPGGLGSVEFEGYSKNNYVDCGPSKGTAFASSFFTVAAWLWISTGYVSNLSVTAHSATGSGGWNLYADYTGNPNEFFLDFAKTGIANTGQSYSTTPLNAGSWHRVAVSLTGSKINFVIDGVLKASSNWSQTYGPYSRDLRIGSSQDDGGYYWDGWLDDVTMWNYPLPTSLLQEDYRLARQSYPGVLERVSPAAWFVKPAGGNAYSLAGAAGAFALAGEPLSPSAGRPLAGEAGTFALTGEALAPSAGRPLAGEAGPFALTGEALAPSAAWGLAGAAGTFALAGEPLSPSAGRSLAGATGTFALTGEALTPSAGRPLAGEAGAFALTGEAASFPGKAALAGNPGSFALTGEAAALNVGVTISGEAGAFALSGEPGSLSAGRPLTGEAGAFALTGEDASFPGQATLSGSPGAFGLTGKPLTPNVGVTFSGEAGGFALTGESALPSTGHPLVGTPGAYALMGEPLTFRQQRGLPCDPGRFGLTGGDMTFPGRGAVLLWAIGKGAPLVILQDMRARDLLLRRILYGDDELPALLSPGEQEQKRPRRTRKPSPRGYKKRKYKQ